MPGSLRLLQPGQQNWFQGNHVVVGQGQGFEPGNLTKNVLKEAFLLLNLLLVQMISTCRRGLRGMTNKLSSMTYFLKLYFVWPQPRLYSLQTELCDLTYRFCPLTSPTDFILWPHLQIVLSDLTYILYSVTSPIDCTLWPHLQIALCDLTYRLYSVTSPTDCTLWPHLQIVLFDLTYRLYYSVTSP